MEKYKICTRIFYKKKYPRYEGKNEDLKFSNKEPNIH